MTRACKLLDAAFQEARTKYAELDKKWIRISICIGSKLPASLLAPTIQRDGELDLLIRCLEDELADLNAEGRAQDVFALRRVNMLSEYWVGGMYETFRLLRQRKLCENSVEFVKLFRELELARIPLEKHEIAKDRQLDAPLTLVKQPQTGSNDEYVYSPDDPGRAHIMSRGVSERGSIMWHVIELKREHSYHSYWVDRRRISDGVLGLWNNV